MYIHVLFMFFKYFPSFFAPTDFTSPASGLSKPWVCARVNQGCGLSNALCRDLCIALCRALCRAFCRDPCRALCRALCRAFCRALCRELSARLSAKLSAELSAELSADHVFMFSFMFFVVLYYSCLLLSWFCCGVLQQTLTKPLSFANPSQTLL